MEVCWTFSWSNFESYTALKTCFWFYNLMLMLYSAGIKTVCKIRRSKLFLHGIHSFLLMEARYELTWSGRLHVVFRSISEGWMMKCVNSFRPAEYPRYKRRFRLFKRNDNSKVAVELNIPGTEGRLTSASTRCLQKWEWEILVIFFHYRRAFKLFEL